MSNSYCIGYFREHVIGVRFYSGRLGGIWLHGYFGDGSYLWRGWDFVGFLGAGIRRVKPELKLRLCCLLFVTRLFVFHALVVRWKFHRWCISFVINNGHINRSEEAVKNILQSPNRFVSFSPSVLQNKLALDLFYKNLQFKAKACKSLYNTH